MDLLGSICVFQNCQCIGNDLLIWSPAPPIYAIWKEFRILLSTNKLLTFSFKIEWHLDIPRYIVLLKAWQNLEKCQIINIMSSQEKTFPVNIWILRNCKKVYIIFISCSHSKSQRHLLSHQLHQSTVKHCFTIHLPKESLRVAKLLPTCERTFVRKEIMSCKIDTISSWILK